MHPKAFNIFVGVVFGVIGLIHFLRLVFLLEVRVGYLQVIVPMWVSIVFLIVSAFMSFYAFRLSKQ